MEITTLNQTSVKNCDTSFLHHFQYQTNYICELFFYSFWYSWHTIWGLRKFRVAKLETFLEPLFFVVNYFPVNAVFVLL